MAQGEREKRKYERIYFSPEEKINGLFVFPDFGQLSFAAPVLDLSLGGLHFSLKREELHAIEMGCSLILSELRMDSTILSDKPISLVVRWMLNHPAVSNVSLGCEFQSFPDESRQAVEEFIVKKLALCRKF